jgi:hypothetical protein
MKLIWLGVWICALAVAQPIGGGLKIGAPLTDAISEVNTAVIQPGASAGSSNGVSFSLSSGNYVIGPYVEVRLPGRFALEVDALYRSFAYATINPFCLSCAAAGTGSNGNWEFPVLAKYKLLKVPIKPYVEGGVILSHLTGSDVNITHAANYGIALGAGVEIHALVLRLTPEIRYDGFVFHSFNDNTFVQTNRNQVMVLVGIGF